MNLIQSIQFQSPLILWLWPVTALVLWWLIRRGQLWSFAGVWRSISGNRFRHPQLSLLRRLYRTRATPTATPAWRRWVAYAVFFLGIHLALAQPFYQGQQLPQPPQYRDTVFSLDSSISMVLRDYVVENRRVDRMTMLKSVMRHLIDRLQGNRIGIVTFAEQAYTLVPLTADYRVLLTQVQRLKPASLTGRTSHLGQALLYTEHSLKQQETKTNKPVLVLVSDVNRPDRHIDPRAAAEYVADQGFRLHVIGIGGASYAASDKQHGGLIYHPSNFALLKTVAERGNGQFYWAKSTESLKAAIQSIQSAEQHTIEAVPRYIPVPLYHWPLLFSIGWLALFSLSGFRRSASS